MQLPHGKIGEGINQIRVRRGGWAAGAGAGVEELVYTKGGQAGEVVVSKPMFSMKASS
jgi:hypothetical protein